MHSAADIAKFNPHVLSIRAYLSRDRSVGIVTRLRAGQMSTFDLLQEQEICLFSDTSRPAVGPFHADVEWILLASCWGREQGSDLPGSDLHLVSRLRMSGAILPLPPCTLYGMHRNNFTLCTCLVWNIKVEWNRSKQRYLHFTDVLGQWTACLTGLLCRWTAYCTVVVVVRRICLDSWRSYGGFSRQV
jgi:hypothetical protein